MDIEIANITWYRLISPFSCKRMHKKWHARVLLVDLWIRKYHHVRKFVSRGTPVSLRPWILLLELFFIYFYHFASLFIALLHVLTFFEAKVLARNIESRGMRLSMCVDNFQIENSLFNYIQILTSHVRFQLFENSFMKNIIFVTYIIINYFQ